VFCTATGNTVTTISKPASGSPRRLHFVDATRATAMLFVFLSHFADSYFRTGGEDPPGIMRHLTLIASPTFLVISGVMIGFLWRTRPSDFNRLRVRLIDRGLFLLTIGHLLITGPFLMRAHGGYLGVSWHYLFTTDVIGVCMIVEPILVTMLKPKTRLIVSGVVFVLSWIAVAVWHPHNLLAEAVEETFFGSSTPVLYVYAFPLLPWFGLDLAGTVLGERLGELWQEGHQQAMLRLLLKVGAGCIATAIGIKALFLGATLVGRPGLFFYALTSPFQKNPPALPYFLFYSGIGIGVILAGWLYIELKGYAILEWAAALGQTSLIMFITQSYVYYSGVYLLRTHLSRPFWPVWLATSMVLVVAPSALWHRLGWNRFITVGYRHLYERRAALRAAQPSAS
jgi:uncharacterized membrane protein